MNDRSDEIRLAEAHRHFLDMSLDPRLPPSLHSLPRKYDIPIRLWQTAFHQLLERLRHALPPLSPSEEASAESDARTQGSLLLDNMTDFIYFSYNFYTALLDEPAFADFRSVWIEQLGDLARYRMAVAGLVVKYSRKQGLSTALAPDDADEGGASDGDSLGGEVSDSDDERPVKDVPPPAELDRGGSSVGVAALNDWDYEEQDTWRNVARDWYAKGISETPTNGRLHHHLALLSKGDEMRTLYHYVKSCVLSPSSHRPRLTWTKLDGAASLSSGTRIDPALLRSRAPDPPHPVRRLHPRPFCPPPRHALHQDLARRL